MSGSAWRQGSPITLFKGLPNYVYWACVHIITSTHKHKLDQESHWTGFNVARAGDGRDEMGTGKPTDVTQIPGHSLLAGPERC